MSIDRAPPTPAQEAATRKRRAQVIRRPRLARRARAVWASLVMLVPLAVMAFVPTKLSPLANVLGAALLSVAVLVFFGGLAGRFAMEAKTRKGSRTTGSAAGVLLWLWLFLATTGALLTWEVAGQLLPGLPSKQPVRTIHIEFRGAATPMISIKTREQ